jgi:hypothetical protein
MREKMAEQLEIMHTANEVTNRNNGRRLVIGFALESSWAPVDESNDALDLDGGNSSDHVLRHYVPPCTYRGEGRT